MTARREERLAELRERYGVEATRSNAEAVSGAKLVVIAVKPQDFEVLLGEVGARLSPEQTVLSIAAAIPTAQIEPRLDSGVPVVRAMPNAPSTVHEGIAGLCAGAHADDEHLDAGGERAPHLGESCACPETAMDAVTAVSGSGPAYFALLAEAMIEAGILLGLSREISTQLVVQTMLGTAKLLRDEKMHPVELREAVTSPGGTTIRAIRELEQAGVRAAFLNAIQAAMERSRELAAGKPVELRVERRRGGGGRARAPSCSPPRRATSCSRAARRRARAYELAAALRPDWSAVRALVGRRALRAARATSARTTGSRADAARPRRERRRRRAPDPRASSRPSEAADALRRGARRASRSTSSCSGSGRDGHTASLFPNAPTLDERERRAVAAPAELEPFVDRVTMTLPVLESRAARRLPRHRRGEGGGGPARVRRAAERRRRRRA